ncbi:MAG TPA: hypothetical protein VJA86_03575 [Candidatus Nanoarchaeia archaeon]|nr:hypothetical protein [Candidatus Nanoarchaeia archaeon]
MGLFGRKEVNKRVSELPELPPLPELPSLPEMPTSKLNESLPSSLPILPSFPSSLSAERFSQAAIKQAVSEPEEAEESEDNRSSWEMGKGIKEMPRTLEITGFSEVKQGKKTAKAEPLFVRIDKFEDALNDFTSIKKKVTEIERTLRDIKDVKTREEAELTAWEREIEALKARIDGIDRGIFEKV